MFIHASVIIGVRGAMCLSVQSVTKLCALASKYPKYPPLPASAALVLLLLLLYLFMGIPIMLQQPVVAAIYTTPAPAPAVAGVVALVHKCARLYRRKIRKNREEEE